MFQITQDEYKKLQKMTSDPVVVVCSKRKKSGGKTYWCAENAAFHRVIAMIRGENLNEKEFSE